MSLRPIEIDKHVHIENDQDGRIQFHAVGLTNDEVAFLENVIDEMIKDVLTMREERLNP